MCGIAGMIHLSGRLEPPAGTLRAMADSLFHRGPDEHGYYTGRGIGLASRRLQIVGLRDGRQPISNEDQTIQVVFNGELFDHPELRYRLEARGHHFRTSCDTELIPHMWEEHQEGTFERLRGQFAIALWDEKRHRLVLGRDRFGICPLYWTRQKTPTGEWLLFASEIKALLASRMVSGRPDPRGINHAFTFFGMPGPVTCFEGIQSLLPGRYLRIQVGSGGRPAELTERTYWEIDFPDRGEEDRAINEDKVIDEFEEVFTASVERRLRADVPVVSYLSGGVDSSTVVAVASALRPESLPTFTVQIEHPKLDESGAARKVSEYVGSAPVVVRFGPSEAIGVYPRLVEAAEAPVIDTSCGALLLLAQEVRARGYKVALTGEGADEWMLGYPWYKLDKVLSGFDVIPRLPLSGALRRRYSRHTGAPEAHVALMSRAEAAVGGSNPWLDVYGMMSRSRWMFYSREMHERLGSHLPYDDLELNLEKMQRWHPANRALYLAGRVHLPGLLLNAKGDRVAMHSSVETRYPFLDEDVFDFIARLHPRWKMRCFTEKYLLRRMAQRRLPRSIAWRRKGMFRAPFDTFHNHPLPAFIEDLLTPESLRGTGYFDVAAVQHWRQAFKTLRPGSYQRTFVEMGLVGVISTQLWHQRFVGI
jgi:asparagine synthase (glutamine-hydrolysing)